MTHDRDDDGALVEQLAQRRSEAIDAGNWHECKKCNGSGLIDGVCCSHCTGDGAVVELDA